MGISRIWGHRVPALTLVLLASPVLANAQGRGRGPAGPPPTPKAAAPVDLTGYWVSIVTEDWRWRMVTPPKGDYASVPLNPDGRKVADAWDAAKDEAAGEQCKAYGAAGLMRLPGRVHIQWENETTLRVDTDAGTQTRTYRFGAPNEPAANPSWQGISIANWETQPAGRGILGAPDTAVPSGALKVVTTHLRPGYLRKNGVPYSENTVLTEYYNATKEPNGDQWLIVTTIVDDPKYLNQRFITSSHFKKEQDGSKWRPTPCSSR
ncbi:MAG TPA: hypothetical protein VIY49_38195 [Bryobacteraceae bacterium]